MWPFKSTPNPHDEALHADFEKAKALMQPLKIVRQSEGFNVAISVCQILTNSDGKIGIKIAQGYSASAIHEINRNGTFSGKGPYWTKKTWRGKPRRFAVCELAISNAPRGMRNPREEIRTYGLSIVEMDTDRLPPMSFDDWRLVFLR